MPVVKVWNDHNLEHVEKFKNNTLRIPPGGYIEMDYIDACDFQGQFFGMKMRGPNDPDPRYFKKIRVEEPTEPVVKADPNVFHATGKAAASPEELAALAKAFIALNPGSQAKDSDAEAAAAKSKSEMQAEIDALRAQLAAKSKPGPKPKVSL